MRLRTNLALLLALSSITLVPSAIGCSRSSCENLLELTGAFDEPAFDALDDFDDLDDDFNDLIDDDDLSDDVEDFCEDWFD